MVEFAEMSARVAQAGFARLGAAAVYRQLNGTEINTRALITDGNVEEGHVNHNSRHARLPAADICKVSRGDRLCVDGREYSVVTQVKRDIDVVEVMLSDKD